MPIKHLLTTLLFLVTFPTYTFAQNWKNLNKQAEKQYASGQYPKAIQSLLQAVEQSKKEQISNEKYSLLLEFLAKIYIELGQYEAAEPLYQEVKTLRSKYLGNKHLDYATSLDNLGILQQLMGKYDQAEPLFQQSLKIREANSHHLHPDYAHTLEQLALLYEQLGIWKKAEQYYLYAKEIKEQTIGKKSMDYATLLHNLAGLYSQQNDFRKAEELYKESLRITEKNTGALSTEYAASLEDLAYIYAQNQKYHAAEQLLRQSLQITEELYGKNHPDYALTISNLAKLYEANQWEIADSLYRNSLTIFAQTVGKQHIFYTNTLFNLAKLHENQGDEPTAETLYLQVIAKKHQEITQIFPALSEAEKLRFYQNTLQFFNSFYVFALKRSAKNPSILVKVFENQMIIKGLLFQNFKQLRATLQKNMDTETVTLYQTWQQKKDWLAQLAYRNSQNWKQQTALSSEKNQLLHDLEDLEKQLALKTQKPLTNEILIDTVENWQKVQQSLLPHEVLVDVIRLQPNDTTVTYLALLTTCQTKGYPQAVVLSNGQELETQALKFYQYSIREQRTDNESYTYFWQPIQQTIGAHLPPLTQELVVYLCPDGVYYQLNLHTLLNPDTGNYLIDEANIYPVGNCSEVIEKTAKLPLSVPTNKGILVACPVLDLPAAKTEVAYIQSIATEKYLSCTTFLDSTATETQVKHLPPAFFLHIATHGFFAQKHPANNPEVQANPLLQCGLRLVRNIAREDDDGILTGVEIMNLDLSPTYLVVLSACETGVGEIEQGEGVFGLQRAFLAAGAEKVIMSLWKVHDRATQLLMVNFYDEWLTTGDLHRAFRSAQLKVRAKYPHPYFWGAFICWK